MVLGGGVGFFVSEVPLYHQDKHTPWYQYHARPFELVPGSILEPLIHSSSHSARAPLEVLRARDEDSRCRVYDSGFRV